MILEYLELVESTTKAPSSNKAAAASVDDATNKDEDADPFESANKKLRHYGSYAGVPHHTHTRARTRCVNVRTLSFCARAFFPCFTPLFVSEELLVNLRASRQHVGGRDTSHVQHFRREVIRDFLKSKDAGRCVHCKAHTPKLRKDGASKVMPLS